MMAFKHISLFHSQPLYDRAKVQMRQSASALDKSTPRAEKSPAGGNEIYNLDIVDMRVSIKYLENQN